MAFKWSTKEGDDVRHTRVSLQGTRQWEELWGALVESAEKFHLVKMQLNLSLPQLHESFFATWSRSGNHRRELLWQSDIPLIVDDQSVGRLNVSGLQNADCASSEISQFIDFVETLEAQLRTLIKHDGSGEDPARLAVERPDSASDDVEIEGAIGRA